MGKIVSLAVGSIIGGFARHFLGGALQRAAGNGFPYGTLLVNASGCFVMGLLHGWGASRLPFGANSRILLMVGFCGAFTTFSTLMFDTSAMMDQGKIFPALFNLAASILLGLSLFRVGAGVGLQRPYLGRSPGRGDIQVQGSHSL